MKLYQITNGSDHVWVVANTVIEALALIPDEHRYWFPYDGQLLERGYCEDGTSITEINLAKPSLVHMHLGKKGWVDMLAKDAAEEAKRKDEQAKGEGR